MKFLGLRTLIYPTNDLATAKNWWQDFLGIAPYFDQPFYVGFLVGGYEIGLNPGADLAFGPVTYIGVDSIAEGLARAEAHGSTAVSPIEDVGEGNSVRWDGIHFRSSSQNGMVTRPPRSMTSTLTKRRHQSQGLVP